MHKKNYSEKRKVHAECERNQKREATKNKKENQIYISHFY
jgi:hypothetical protein